MLLSAAPLYQNGTSEESMKGNNKIIENYRDNEILRNEFHNSISEVFPSISFKEWYSKGF